MDGWIGLIWMSVCSIWHFFLDMRNSH
jgi:hypothetical protein